MKINLLMAGLIFLATPMPVQAQGQQPSEFTIKIAPAELDLIGKGLGKLPFEDVAPLIQKLRQQVMDQQKPPVALDKAPEQK